MTDRLSVQGGGLQWTMWQELQLQTDSNKAHRQEDEEAVPASVEQSGLQILGLLSVILRASCILTIKRNNYLQFLFLLLDEIKTMKQDGFSKRLD